MKLGVSSLIINSPKAKHTINTPNSARSSAQLQFRAEKSTSSDNATKIENKKEVKLDKMVPVTVSAENPQSAQSTESHQGDKETLPARQLSPMPA